MLSSSFIAAVVASLALVQASPVARQATPSPGPVPIVANAHEIAVSLKAEPSVNDRLKKLLTNSNGELLTGDELRQLTVFDYNQQKPNPGAQGGSILLATVENFPILEELGISGAISLVEPCGMNIPHLHPRANEILTVIDGQLDTGFVMENGFNGEVKTQLGTYQATIFPQGSIHYQQNPTCSKAAFVASLNSEDPGRSDIATSYFMLDSAVIDASLGFPHQIGGSNINEWKSHLPANLALGVEECLARCGITAAPAPAPSGTATASASAQPSASGLSSLSSIASSAAPSASASSA